MMENAGRGLAVLARARFLDGDPIEKTVIVLAGTGGNGGGALVCARRLQAWGAAVHIVTTRTHDAFRPVPADQLSILKRSGLEPTPPDEIEALPEADLIIDGLIGYSLAGAPRGAAAELIRWANTRAAPVLSLDVPSGMDPGAGVIHDPAVVAEATLTLALPKHGLISPQARQQTGELYLGDISVPPSLYERMGIEVGPIFAESDILYLG
jgi:NAD(P)H-hydrate epimerase